VGLAAAGPMRRLGQPAWRVCRSTCRSGHPCSRPGLPHTPPDPFASPPTSPQPPSLPPVGNPHSLGAKPKTFTRQVVALCAAPWLLDDPRAAELFPPDALERARVLSGAFSGGVGAYSDSRGNPHVRAEVAAFIEERDGHPANPDVSAHASGGPLQCAASSRQQPGAPPFSPPPPTTHPPRPCALLPPPHARAPPPQTVFLTDGASPAVRIMLNALIRDLSDAVLVPIPQYPLYSAAIQMLGARDAPAGPGPAPCPPARLGPVRAPRHSPSLLHAPSPSPHPLPHPSPPPP
jgi:hypothetical protein